MGNTVFAIYLGLCSFQDIRRKQISVGLLLAGAAAAIVCGLCGERRAFAWFLSLLPGLGLLLFACATHEAIGYGDGVMVLTAGLFLDLGKTIALLWLALFLAAVFSLIGLLTRKCSRKSACPFAPFLLLAWLFLWWGGRK